eukprot:scaffold5248_cov49-Phaeocystis_antarctica.AAC.5
MPRMAVTLDVSKLSGWLNADAPCRVARRAYDAERGADWEAGEAWAGGSARAACTARGPGCVKAGGGYRVCAERTKNMPLMSVTLDVSKLSGWLNADAPCRVARRAYDAERGADWEAGGRGPAAAHERHARREGPAV